MQACKRLLLSLILFVGILTAAAQDRIISGTVTSSESGYAPLSGVTVKVKGINRSTQTDGNGNFTITAKTGDVLQFTYVGFEPLEYRVAPSGSVSIRLTRADDTMNEVIVTAMDIKRNPKELPYSVQKVSGAEIAETQRENFMNSLQGRVAGLTINPTSGIAGASSQIVLRGFNSLALDNSPLFVIDGVIVDNQTMSENHGGGGPGSALGLASARENRNNDYSNRISDLNPNDIESITVLKGPEATALYGSQASSGAIVITTKKGTSTGRVSVSYDNSFRMSKQTRYPDYQTIYDGGISGQPTNVFSYFGPAFDGGTTLYNNRMSDFFRTGFAQSHNLSADYGQKNYTFRISGSLFNQDATVPTNTFNRYTARISNTTKIGKYIDISPSVSFIRSGNSKPLRGLSGYMLNLLAWPADNDFKDWQNPSGEKKPLYAANPNAEIDNPFFNVNRNRSEDRTNRMTSTLGVNINPLSWLSLSGRFGYDRYETEGYIIYHPSSFYVTRASGGLLDNYYRNYKGYNHTVTATARHSIGDFSGRILVGNMWQDNETSMFAIAGSKLVDSVNTLGQMMKDGVVISQSDYENLIGSWPDSSLTRSVRTKLLNAARTGTNIPNYSIYRQLAYFGEASISWRNAIFLSYSHRFEEASVFPKEFRNYNYPAGGISVMLSDLIPGIKGKFLNYAKLRGSRASTARSSSPYSNQPTFNQNLGSGGGYYLGFLNANPLLRPERQNTYELGTELRLFNNRLNLDATYYNTKNHDLIVEQFRASYGTGFVLNTLNVGANQNTGIEISLEGSPLQTKNLRWTSRLNFNRMRNKVTELPPNVSEFYISDTWLYGFARGGLKVGGPTTTITGLGYQRNNNGDILVNPANGLPLGMPSSAPFKVLGDRNPHFTLGSLNTLSYKNFRVSMLWDLRVGGDVFNGTEMYLTRIGRSLRTADRMRPQVVNGVLNDGLQNTANPTRNTIAVIPFYNQEFFTFLPEEEFIEKDINALRLRDLSINYNLPQNKINNLRYFQSLSVFITGNDLILITNYTGADPSVNGNTAGSRGVGAFGFDYGNVGTPVSINVGIRANF